MRRIVISGSTAYDTILHMPGNINENIENNILSSFSTISESQKFHGGTGANIIYNLCLLGESAILLSSVGFGYEFSDLITEKAILKYIHKDRLYDTASSIIISDENDTRMTFFSENSMKFASESKPEYISETIGIALISANHIPTMLSHAKYFHEKNIPVILDPAQQISQMTSEQVKEFIHSGNILILNHFELSEISEKTGYSFDELEHMFEVLIITYGENGSHIFSKNEGNFQIPAIPVSDFEDTTGAGDAYRAALCVGILEGWSLKTSCQLGTILASYSILTSGAQNHHVSLGNLMEDMKCHFGSEINLYQRRNY